jgi:hypothetical protein
MRSEVAALILAVFALGLAIVALLLRATGCI